MSIDLGPVSVSISRHDVNRTRRLVIDTPPTGVYTLEIQRHTVDITAQYAQVGEIETLTLTLAEMMADAQLGPLLASLPAILDRVVIEKRARVIAEAAAAAAAQAAAVATEARAITARNATADAATARVDATTAAAAAVIAEAAADADPTNPALATAVADALAAAAAAETVAVAAEAAAATARAAV